MKQELSSYDYLADFLDRFPYVHEDLKLEFFIMKIREKLNLNFTAVYSVNDGEYLCLDTFQGDPGRFVFKKGENICGKAWVMSSSIIEGNQIAIPIYGDITVKQMFFAEGNLDQEDMHKLETLLSSFSDPGFKQKLEYYRLTKEMVYQKMCNVIEFMEQSHKQFIGNFQDFVMVCAFACLAKKPIVRGTRQPGSEAELRDELSTLFPGCTFKPYPDNSNFSCIETPKWECRLGCYNGKPEFIISGKSFFCNYSPMRGVLPLKAFDQQFDLLKEWFPEECTLQQYVDKIRKVHEIVDESVNAKAKDALEPHGINYKIRLNCFNLDTIPEYIAMNVEVNSECCLTMQRMTEEQFNSVLPILPGLVNELNTLTREEMEEKVLSLRRKLLPKRAEIEHMNWFNSFNPVHVTLSQL